MTRSTKILVAFRFYLPVVEQNQNCDLQRIGSLRDVIKEYGRHRLTVFKSPNLLCVNNGMLRHLLFRFYTECPDLFQFYS